MFSFVDINKKQNILVKIGFKVQWKYLSVPEEAERQTLVNMMRFLLSSYKSS